MIDHDSPGDRADRQSANLARHLNDQHSGTLLLLARHATGGRPDASAAELVGVDDRTLALTATVPQGQVDLPLDLPDGPDIRRQIGALLQATRRGLPDDGSVPLTSLELQMAGDGRGPHGASDR